MKKSVFLETYVHEASIQSGHQFLHFAQIHVAHIELGLTSFLLELDQRFILHEGDGNLFGCDVNH
jgi:hypothetical protein